MKITVLIALLVVSIARADQPLTVAVYDFTGDVETAGYGDKVTTLVTADLTGETNLVMVERAELSKALRELAFGISGMVNSEAAAEIGQITGAKVLVAGRVIKTEGNHLVIIANIIGTETGRLFASKVEGPADSLLALTTELSRNIARTIAEHATNLVTPVVESHERWMERVLKSIKGNNRPNVSVTIMQHNGLGNHWRNSLLESEFGVVLLKAGFPVADENSDKKPDLQITGVVVAQSGLPRGGLLTGRAVVDVKVQERRTGNIIVVDRQEATVSGIGLTAELGAETKAVDGIIERILPSLAQ